MPPKHTAPTVSSKRAAPAKKPNLTIHLQLDPKNAIHLLVKKGKRQVAKIDFTNEYKLLLFMYVLSIKHVHGINHAGVHGMQYVEAKAITVASKSFAVSGTVHTDDEWLDSDDDDVFTDDDDDEDDEEYDEEDDEEDDEEEDEESDTDSYEESYNGTEDEMYSDESSEDTSDMDDDTRKNYLCPNDDVENNSTKKAAPKPAAKKINSTPLNKNRRQKSTTKKTRNDDDDDLAYFFKERLGWSASEASIAINGDESLTRTFYRRLEEGAELVEITKKVIDPVTGKVKDCKEQRFFTSIPEKHRDKVFMEKVEVEVEVPVDAAEKTTRAGKKPAGKKPKPKMKKIRQSKLQYRECLKKVVDTQEWEDEMVKLLTDPATYDSTVFIQDNAPCHVAKSNYTTFREWGLLVLPWPPNSPDLNVIENAWSVMNGKYKERLVPDEVFAPPIEAARGRLSKTMSALDRASHTTKDRVRLLWMQEEIATIVASEAFEASKRWLVVSLRHRVQYLLEHNGTFIKDMGPFRRAHNIIKQVYEESQCKDEVFDPSRHTIDDVILNPKMTFTKTVNRKKKTQTLTEAVESKKYLPEFQFGDTRLSTKLSAQPHKKGMTSSELIAHHRQKRIEKNAQAQAAASDAAPSPKDKKNRPETPKQKMNKDQQQLFDNIG